MEEPAAVIEAPKPRPSYEALFPSCWQAGCTDDLEPGEQACWRHMNVSAF